MEKAIERIQEVSALFAWDDRVFQAALNLEHARISCNGKPSPERWEMHQQLNRAAHELRSKNTGKMVVFGFFTRDKNAQEVSLFDAIDWSSELRRDLVIGFGCEDMQERAPYWLVPSSSGKSGFSLAKDHDFGWIDGMGEHVEFYSAETRTLTRESMTGRTSYEIVFNENGRAERLRSGGHERKYEYPERQLIDVPSDDFDFDYEVDHSQYLSDEILAKLRSGDLDFLDDANDAEQARKLRDGEL